MDRRRSVGAQRVLSGGEWVTNEARNWPLLGRVQHSSPYLTAARRPNPSDTAHVTSMSDATGELDPFEMWDEEELSARTGFHVRKIQRWRKDGGGPPFILQGKKPRYRAISVLRWLEESERTTDRVAS